MNDATRRMHQRGLLVAAAGIVVGVLSQANWFAASENHSRSSRLPVETTFATVVVSPSRGPGEADARPIPVQNSNNSDRGHAAETRTYVIAASAGYGIEECLGEGGECGKVVADAWCETDGRHAAQKYGQSGEDLSRVSNASSSAPRPYFVTCGG
jgi:hypothetical protein